MRIFGKVPTFASEFLQANMTRILMICAVVTAIPIYAQTNPAEVAEPRIGWQVEAISEGQWNMSNGSGNWANMLSVRIDARTWRGGTVEMP